MYEISEQLKEEIRELINNGKATFLHARSLEDVERSGAEEKGAGIQRSGREFADGARSERQGSEATRAAST